MKSYIRFEYEEALSGKKEVLASQISLLQLIKKTKNYRKLRKQELILKTKLKRELNRLNTEIKNLREIFPEEAEKVKNKVRKKRVEERRIKDIEAQLKEISEKLAKLQ